MLISRLRSTIIIPVLILGCAGSGPPLPDHTVEADGQAAARLFGEGDFTAALQLYRRVSFAAGRFDVPVLAARYRFNIGRIYYECAAYDSALRCFRESRAMFAAEGKTSDAAIAGVFEALTKAYAGEVDSAALMLGEFIPSVRSGDAATIATATMIIALLQGDAGAAARSGERTLEQLQKSKDHHGCGVIYYYLAMAAFMRQRNETARRCLDSSLFCYERSPQRYRNWKTLLGRAIVEYCDGRQNEGNRYYERAKSAAPKMVDFPAPDLVRHCPASWAK